MSLDKISSYKITTYKIIKLIISVAILSFFAYLTLPGITDSVEKKNLDLCHNNKVKIAMAYKDYLNKGGKLDLTNFLKPNNYRKYFKTELVCPSYDESKSKYVAKNGTIFCPYHPKDIVYAGNSLEKSKTLEIETAKLKKVVFIYKKVIKNFKEPDKKRGTLLRKAFYEACEKEKINRRVDQVLLDDLGLIENGPLYWDADYYSPTKMILYYARPKNSATYWNAELALTENGRVYISLGLDQTAVRNNVGTVVMNTTYAAMESKLVANGFTFSGTTLNLNN